jgi:glycosyltransferase involved in cell wall biosynthesis
VLEIVAVTYNHGRKLDIFINSVLEQTDPNWKLSVYHDGPANTKTLAIINRLADERIFFYQTATRANQFGHNLRELGIKQATEKYINQQNADNYLTPKFVELMLAPTKEADLDLIYCDILHSYPNVNFDGKGPYNVLNSFPCMNRIDIANFIMKTELAQAIGFPWRDYAADGIFIDQFMKLYGNKGNFEKTDSCLLVHN